MTCTCQHGSTGEGKGGWQGQTLGQTGWRQVEPPQAEAKKWTVELDS